MNATANKGNVNNALVTDIKGLMEMCGCGRGSAEKIAAEAKAVVRIGRRKLYKVDKINAYLDSLCV